jgi:ABC-2 type transport system ATP-binding protein
MLNYVGLDEERYRAVETYSTGMRQRVKLAQAIVHDPKVVFLDEPTNGLDPKGRDEMLNLVRDLAYKRDISVILSSHLLPDVEFVCQQVVVLNKGQVAAAGPIEELKKRDLTRYEVRVKGETATFISLLQRQGCTVTVDEDGLIHAVMPLGKDAGVLLQTAAQTKVQLRHFYPERNTLEDVFMQTLGVS